MKKWKPIFIENSLLPRLLSRLAPIEISAITLGFIVFGDAKMSEKTRRHETIHFQQFLETLFIGFILLYATDYVYNFAKHRDGKVAYGKIRAEQEAYEYDEDEEYLINRKRWRWLFPSKGIKNEKKV